MYRVGARVKEINAGWTSVSAVPTFYLDVGPSVLHHTILSVLDKPAKSVAYTAVMVDLSSAMLLTRPETYVTFTGETFK